MPQNGVFVLFVYSLQGIDKQISLKTAFQRVFYHTEKLFENIYENSIKTLDNSNPCVFNRRARRNADVFVHFYAAFIGYAQDFRAIQKAAYAAFRLYCRYRFAADFDRARQRRRVEVERQRAAVEHDSSDTVV